jgi:hypothetical protein
MVLLEKLFIKQTYNLNFRYLAQIYNSDNCAKQQIFAPLLSSTQTSKFLKIPLLKKIFMFSFIKIIYRK